MFVLFSTKLGLNASQSLEFAFIMVELPRRGKSSSRQLLSSQGIDQECKMALSANRRILLSSFTVSYVDIAIVIGILKNIVS